MAAARVELKVIAASVTAAEKASPEAIAQRGLAALRQGQTIWSVAEGKSERELARAWLLWALPARCASNATELTARSLLLGSALKYNTSAPSAPAPTPDQAAASDTIDSILANPGDAPPTASDAPAGSDAAPSGGSPAAAAAPSSAPPPAEAPPAGAPPATDAPAPAPARPYPY
jgi:hypothetical protein